jgi:GDPmannose 4,6-dehydratase
VREFCESAFAHAGLDYRDHVEIDPRYYRPAEVDVLQADASVAAELLGWRPRTGFHALVRMMADADSRLAAREALAGSILV